MYEERAAVLPQGSARAVALAFKVEMAYGERNGMGVQEQEQLWGGETTKAVANFPGSGETVPVPVIRWLGRIKAAAARVNAELGLLDHDLAERIAVAGDRVAAGEFDDQF